METFSQRGIELSLKKERNKLTGQLESSNQRLASLEAKLSELESAGPTSAGTGQDAGAERMKSQLKAMVERLENLDLES